MDTEAASTGLEDKKHGSLKPRRSKAPLVGLIVGIALSALFLWLVLRKADLGAAWAHLKQIRLVHLLFPLAASLMALVIKAARWLPLFSREHRPSFWVSFHALAIGNFMNLILPARAGDVVRCLVLRQASSIRTSTALGALGVEKIFDGFTALLLLALSLLAFDLPAWMINLRNTALVCLLVVLFVLIMLRCRSRQASQVITRVFQWVRCPQIGERVAGLLEGFVLGLQSITSPTQLAIVVVLSLGAWLAEGAMVWGVAHALHVPLSLTGGVGTSSLTAVGMLIPAAPGYVGTFEYFMVSAVELFGLPAEQGLALALVMHLWIYLTVSVTGIASMLITGQTWTRATGRVLE